MATFYIHRQSKQRYPNVLAQFNSHHRTPVSFIFSADYASGKKIVHLGTFTSKTAAISEAKRYAHGRLNTKTIDFKYMKDGKAVR